MQLSFVVNVVRQMICIVEIQLGTENGAFAALFLDEHLEVLEDNGHGQQNT